ncbi:MAG: hypothetical protein B0D84_05685, partial [Candidatus Sedimenticola endophacoides]
LRQRIRRLDTLARLGGDEFVLVMTQISGREDARALAEALLESLREPFVLPDGETITLGASIGVSLCPEDAGQPDQLIEFAERSARLSPGRQVELAELLRGITGKQGDAAVCELHSYAQWLTRGR